MSVSRQLDETIERMQSLLAAGEAALAADEGRQYMASHSYAECSSEFYGVLAQACRATGDLWSMSAPHFDQLSELSRLDSGTGDQLLAGALFWIDHIKTRDEREVMRLLGQVRELHRPDQNRLAMADFVEGRFHYSLGKYEEAHACFRRASTTWQELKLHDEPYSAEGRRDSRFFRMLVHARQGNRLGVRAMAGKILSDTRVTNREHIRVAKILRVFPSLVMFFDHKYHS